LPHVVIDFHDFRDGYGLPIERINPHRIKNKNVQEIELFGEAQGRSRYSFVNCHNAQVMDRIKERYPIVYNKTNLLRNKLIRKEFARGILVKFVKGKKVSWPRFKPTLTKGPSGFLGWKNALKKRLFCWARL
jgi:hypothetical protein